MRGLPRLFLTANSGARIGMAQSLKDKFEVCFVDPADPAKGFKYLYLTPGACLSHSTPTPLSLHSTSLHFD